MVDVERAPRCSCCPYGYHIDLGFLQFVNDVKRGPQMKNLKKIYSKKQRLRHSIEDVMLQNGMSSQSAGKPNDTKNRSNSKPENQDPIQTVHLNPIIREIDDSFSDSQQLTNEFNPSNERTRRKPPAAEDSDFLATSSADELSSYNRNYYANRKKKIQSHNTQDTALRNGKLLYPPSPFDPSSSSVYSYSTDQSISISPSLSGQLSDDPSGVSESDTSDIYNFDDDNFQLHIRSLLQDSYPSETKEQNNVGKPINTEVPEVMVSEGMRQIPILIDSAEEDEDRVFEELERLSKYEETESQSSKQQSNEMSNQYNNLPSGSSISHSSDPISTGHNLSSAVILPPAGESMSHDHDYQPGYQSSIPENGVEKELAAVESDKEIERPASVDPATLHQIRQQIVLSLQQIKKLEQQVKTIPMLQMRLSVMKEEKRLLKLQLLEMKNRQNEADSKKSTLNSDSSLDEGRSMMCSKCHGAASETSKSVETKSYACQTVGVAVRSCISQTSESRLHGSTEPRPTYRSLTANKCVGSNIITVDSSCQSLPFLSDYNQRRLSSAEASGDLSQRTDPDFRLFKKVLNYLREQNTNITEAAFESVLHLCNKTRNSSSIGIQHNSSDLVSNISTSITGSTTATRNASVNTYPKILRHKCVNTEKSTQNSIQTSTDDIRSAVDCGVGNQSVSCRSTGVECNLRPEVIAIKPQQTIKPFTRTEKPDSDNTPSAKDLAVDNRTIKHIGVVTEKFRPTLVRDGPFCINISDEDSSFKKYKPEISSCRSIGVSTDYVLQISRHRFPAKSPILKVVDGSIKEIFVSDTSVNTIELESEKTSIVAADTETKSLGSVSVQTIESLSAINKSNVRVRSTQCDPPHTKSIGIITEGVADSSIPTDNHRGILKGNRNVKDAVTETDKHTELAEETHRSATKKPICCNFGVNTEKINIRHIGINPIPEIKTNLELRAMITSSTMTHKKELSSKSQSLKDSSTETDVKMNQVAQTRDDVVMVDDRRRYSSTSSRRNRLGSLQTSPVSPDYRVFEKPPTEEKSVATDKLIQWEKATNTQEVKKLDRPTNTLRATTAERSSNTEKKQSVVKSTNTKTTRLVSRSAGERLNDDTDLLVEDTEEMNHATATQLPSERQPVFVQDNKELTNTRTLQMSGIGVGDNDVITSKVIETRAIGVGDCDVNETDLKEAAHIISEWQRSCCTVSVGVGDSDVNDKSELVSIAVQSDISAVDTSNPTVTSESADANILEAAAEIPRTSTPRTVNFRSTHSKDPAKEEHLVHCDRTFGKQELMTENADVTDSDGPSGARSLIPKPTVSHSAASRPTETKKLKPIIKQSSRRRSPVSFLDRKRREIVFADELASDVTASDADSSVRGYDSPDAAENADDELTRMDDEDEQTEVSSASGEKHHDIDNIYVMETEMLSACNVYALWLKDSTEVTTKQLNASLRTIRQEWFRVAGTKTSEAVQVNYFLSSLSDVSQDLPKQIINMTDDNGNTALHYAISNCNFDLVNQLLDTGICDVNKQNRAGCTAIILASVVRLDTEQHIQIVQRLFHLGDVNIKASLAGQTALMLAVSRNRYDIVKLLLEADADVNIQDDDGSTALMSAAEHGYMDIVKLLLTKPNCDLTLTDNDGGTVLSIAMEAGHRDIGVLLYSKMNLKQDALNSPKRRRKKKIRSSKPSS